MMKNKVSPAPVGLAAWGAALCEIQHPYSLGYHEETCPALGTQGRRTEA